MYSYTNIKTQNKSLNNNKPKIKIEKMKKNDKNKNIFFFEENYPNKYKTINNNKSTRKKRKTKKTLFDNS